jgi:hypothetical protein
VATNKIRIAHGMSERRLLPAPCHVVVNTAGAAVLWVQCLPRCHRLQ